MKMDKFIPTVRNGLAILATFVLIGYSFATNQASVTIVDNKVIQVEKEVKEIKVKIDGIEQIEFQTKQNSKDIKKIGDKVDKIEDTTMKILILMQSREK